VPPASSGSQPKHHQIAAELLAAIEAGEYPPGAKLPGENDVTRDYGVSRDTARQALGLLANWGVAEARKGSGVYVRHYRPILSDRIRRLGTATWPAGASVWTRETEGRNLGIDQIEVRRAVPPERIRELLGLAPGEEGVMRDRRYSVDGKPVMVACTWIPARLAAGTAIEETDTGPGGTLARLRDLGHAPVRFREDTRARMLPDTDPDAQRLMLGPGMPVMEIFRTAFDAAGEPVEATEMRAEASAYIFRYDFEA
jgi:GntR family transcriptional regulator